MQCVNNDFITVYKCGMHYDAMTLIHGTSVGMCNMYKDDMFTSDAGWNNSQHVCIGDVYNCSSEARVSSNIDRNSPDKISHRTKETREMIPDLPICHPVNDSRNSMKYVKILSWNIHGLSQDKLSDDILGTMLKGYDIILLSETWASDLDDFVLEGFEYHNYPRKCMHLNGARNSGGLGVFIRQSIRESIDIWCHTEDIVVWYLLRKSFFGIKNDIVNTHTLFLNSLSFEPSHMGLLLESGMAGLLGHLTFVGHWLHPQGFPCGSRHRMCRPEVLEP